MGPDEKSRGDVIFIISFFILAAFNLFWCLSAGLIEWVSLFFWLFKAKIIDCIFVLEFLPGLLGDGTLLLTLPTTLFFKTYLSPLILLNSWISANWSGSIPSLLALNDFLCNGDLAFSASNFYIYCNSILWSRFFISSSVFSLR